MYPSAPHATFVPGHPGRAAHIALWPLSDDTDSSADEVRELTLIRPDENGVVGPVATKARLIPMTDAVDQLCQTSLSDLHASRSFRAWGQVARVALQMIARGSLRPIVDGGADAWDIAPLADTDHRIRAALAGWIPPECYCLIDETAGDSRPTEAAAAVIGLQRAIADILPRTSAAGILSGLNAWASPTEIADVTRHANRLGGVEELDRHIVGLRLVIPGEDQDSFRVDLQMRSHAEPDVIVDVSDLWMPGPTGLGQDAEHDLLKTLHRGASAWPALERLLEEASPTTLELNDDEAMALLGPLADDLAACGIEVLVPTTLTRSIRINAHVTSTTNIGTGPARFALDEICELRWTGTLDGEELTDEELATLAAATRPLIRLRDEWIVVDKSVLTRLETRGALTNADALAAALTGIAIVDGDEYEVEVTGTLADFAERIKESATVRELPEPEGLHTELRPYQRRGLAWLVEMTELGLGGVLADDMGLGKTVQLIALHLQRIEQATARDEDLPSPTLVVCPASTVGNWEHELARFAPSITVHRYHGPERSLDDVGPGDVVVTTYGLARRDRDELADREWGLVVADEAQHLKNASTAIARTMRAIPADSKLCMTGTPIENRVGELWSLLDWTTPGLLGDAATFTRNVAIPVERDRDERATDRFRRVVSPFLLRRRKDDPEIVPELPPKTETAHPLQLTSEQATLYRTVTEEVMRRVHDADGIARRGMVLELLTRLKQVCNHPAHYLGESGPLVGRSGKLDAFEDLIAAITDAGDSTLVFTQYVAMGDLLVSRLSQLGIETQFLHGACSLTKRTEMVEQFQSGDFPVFVISLRAGGTGLNLTQATHVIHYDRWWNPAVEQQASDRAWRIGQDRPVQIHHLISEGTLEERIAQVLDDKRQLAESVVGGGEAWIGQLSDEDLDSLVRLGTDVY